MKFAIIRGAVSAKELAANACVENVIVARPDQRAELEEALRQPLIEAEPLGLQPGDLYNGVHWTRNVGGEQVALPIEESDRTVAEILADLEGGA